MLDKWIRRLRADPSDEEAVVRIVSELIRLNRLLELGDYVSLEQLHDAGLINDDVYEIGINERLDTRHRYSERIFRENYPVAEDVILIIACLALTHPMVLRFFQSNYLINHPWAESLIRNAARHSNQSIRYYITIAVGESTEWDDIDFFIELLNDSNDLVAREAAISLRERGSSERAMHALIAVLRQRRESGDILSALGCGRGEWDVSPAIQAADEIYHSCYGSLRTTAIHVLNSLTSGEYDQEFLRILLDSPHEIGANSVAASQALKSPESIPAIGTLLQQDIPWQIRRNLLECLSNMRSIRAFPFLFMAEQGDDDQLAGIAEEGLYRLGINSGGRGRMNALVNARSACRNDPDPVIREAAMRLII